MKSLRLVARRKVLPMQNRPAIISIIVAMAENRVIGRDGDLPWHISEDLKRFKHLTIGHTIIMGRKTHESIGRPLPKRRSIIISRQADYAADGVEVAQSLDAAVEMAASDEEAFVIGGSSIYAAALPLADRLYVTRVHAEVAGDVFFPDFDTDDWQQIEASPKQTDEKSGLTYSFVVFQRKTG